MKLSIIIPCYNEEKNINIIYKQITNIIGDIQYELLFINDGSTDKTKDIIKKLYNDDPDHVKAISFSRNFGKDAAIYAGIKHASGEYTSIIGANNQQDPKHILEMVDFLDKNEDIDQVTMYIKSNKKAFSKLFSKLTKIDSREVSNFRTFRLNIRRAILSLNETNRFSKGIFSWIGFNTHYLPYEVKEQKSNISLIKAELNNIMNYSAKPLKFINIIGIILLVISIICFIIILINSLLFNISGGNFLIITTIVFFSGIQMFCIGVLGEYLAKTYLETKKRPIYIEKDKIGFNDKDNFL